MKVVRPQGRRRITESIVNLGARRIRIMQNYYLQEKLAEGHRQDLLREAAQQRMYLSSRTV
jgi:hypothetical protein